MIIFQILALVVIIRVLISTGKPLWCALSYAAFVAVVGLLSGKRLVLSEARLEPILVTSALAFAASGIYFWLLKRFNESFLWWPILIAGFLLILFLVVCQRAARVRAERPWEKKAVRRHGQSR